MNAYETWNDRLARRFFNTDMAGRNVNLQVNSDLIREIEQEMPELATFKGAVAGPPTNPRYCERVCDRALQSFQNWRDDAPRFPPYIGYLSFFILASDIDGDFAPHAYYPRLWELLGFDDGRRGPVPQFSQMHQLWDDLEDWSVRDLRGELGVFQSRSIGAHIHIGYPLSQSLIVEQERRDLPRIFDDAGLTPGTDIPTDELVRALRGPTGRRLLRTKTTQLLETRHDPDLYEAFLDAVADELATWDGTINTAQGTAASQDSALGGLHLCLNIDRISGTARASLRCKFNRDIPEDGIIVNDVLEATEFAGGWSTPLTDIRTDQILDASKLDWSTGQSMRVSSHGWQLRLPNREVRILTTAEPEGFSGLVERHSLPQGQPFYLLYPDYAWQHLETWTAHHCEQFRKIEITQGLPEGWNLAESRGSSSDAGVKERFPILSSPSKTRIKLVGGIRSGAGNSNNYFEFAPPSASLTGTSLDVEIFCNDQKIATPDQHGLFELPTDLPVETRIIIEAKRNQEVVHRLSVFLTGDFSLSADDTGAFLDQSGNSVPAGRGGPSIYGPHVTGMGSEPAMTAAELFEDLEDEIGTFHGFLIGTSPGQTISWPATPFPYDWVPTWIVTKRGRKMSAIFVGDTFAQYPAHDRSRLPDRRAVNDWITLLWVNRKRIALPRSKSERDAWQRLQLEARDARQR